MEYLYVSDLDGTLLNKNAELSQVAVDGLNELIARGISFSVATARTAASVQRILEKVQIELPVILMNGVVRYDLKNKIYLDAKEIGTESMRNIVEAMEENQIHGFLYTLDDNQLMTYYEELDTKALYDFCQERRVRYQKPFGQVESFLELLDHKIIYSCMLDRKERLLPVYERLRADENLGMTFYQDIYSEDLWYLEVFSREASKYHAAVELKATLQAEKMIGFGDNLNDLPLFEACDVTCAVKNANPQLKEQADHLIASNEENGVVAWLNENGIAR